MKRYQLRLAAGTTLVDIHTLIVQQPHKLHQGTLK